MEKENWDFVTIEILELKIIQIRKLNTAVDLIKIPVEINALPGEPIPIRDFEYGKSTSIPMEEKSEKYTKKKVSFMGGNFDPIASLFYKKKKSSAQIPIFLGEYENKNNNVIISGLIEGDDWRSDRMDKDDSGGELIEPLKNPNISKNSNPSQTLDFNSYNSYLNGTHLDFETFTNSALFWP